MTDTKPKPSKLDAAIKRAAAADTARIRADLDALSARAELAGMPARQVAAIRRAWDLFMFLGWAPAEMRNQIDVIEGIIIDAEAHGDAAKARD